MSDKSIVIRTADIETSPNLAHVWNFWKTNVGVNQVIDDAQLMSFAYKDLNGDWVYYEDMTNNSYEELVLKASKMIDEADILIGHNFKKFDMRWICGQCAVLGISPPSPPVIIDTYLECKKYFHFPSYKLEYLSRVFGCDVKDKHKKFPGHELWVECLKGNKEAWEEMENYNCQDVETNEQLYLKIRPWIKSHPNLALMTGKTRPSCPTCGSSDIQYRGYAFTKVSAFHRFQCNSCGSWGRERTNALSEKERKSLLTN